MRKMAACTVVVITMLIMVPLVVALVVVTSAVTPTVVRAIRCGGPDRGAQPNGEAAAHSARAPARHLPGAGVEGGIGFPSQPRGVLARTRCTTLRCR
jgi:hypothetical protein